VARRCRVLASRLGIGSADLPDIEGYVNQYMDKKFSTGKKGDLIIGACIYITCRKNKLPVTLLDISRVVQYNMFEVGKYFTRAKVKLQLRDLEFESGVLIDHMLSSLEVPENMRRRINALSQDILTETKDIEVGRRPNIVAGAAIILACQANNIDIEKGLVAKVVHASTTTVGKRLAELKTYFVNLAKSMLPFAETVTVKTVHNIVPDAIKHLKVVKPLQQRENDRVKTSPKYKE